MQNLNPNWRSPIADVSNGTEGRWIRMITFQISSTTKRSIVGGADLTLEQAISEMYDWAHKEGIRLP